MELDEHRGEPQKGHLKDTRSNKGRASWGKKGSREERGDAGVGVFTPQLDACTELNGRMWRGAGRSEDLPGGERHGIPRGSDCKSMRLAEGTRALPRPRQQFGVIENTQCLLKETARGTKPTPRKRWNKQSGQKRSSWGPRNGAAEAATMTWPHSLLKQSKSRCWLTGKLSRAIGPHLNGDRLSWITHSPASLKIPSRSGHGLQKSTKEPQVKTLSLLERHLSKAQRRHEQQHQGKPFSETCKIHGPGPHPRASIEFLTCRTVGRHQGMWKREWQQSWREEDHLRRCDREQAVFIGQGQKIKGREGIVPSDKCIQAWTGGLVGACWLYFCLSFQWYFLLSSEPIV